MRFITSCKTLIGIFVLSEYEPSIALGDNVARSLRGEIRALIASNQVTVFKDSNYKGSQSTYMVGDKKDYTQFVNVRNDHMSSIRVGDCAAIKLYEHSRFRGKSVTITHDTEHLSWIGWNDKASGLQVLNHPCKGVTFYRDSDYRGFSAKLGPGSYSLNDFSKYGLRDNDISSLKVDDGYKVEVFVATSFQSNEEHYTFDKNIDKLSKFDINDRISSFIITKSIPDIGEECDDECGEGSCQASRDGSTKCQYNWDYDLRWVPLTRGTITTTEGVSTTETTGVETSEEFSTALTTGVAIEQEFNYFSAGSTTVTLEISVENTWANSVSKYEELERSSSLETSRECPDICSDQEASAFWSYELVATGGSRKDSISTRQGCPDIVVCTGANSPPLCPIESCADVSANDPELDISCRECCVDHLGNFAACEADPTKNIIIQYNQRETMNLCKVDPSSEGNPAPDGGYTLVGATKTPRETIINDFHMLLEDSASCEEIVTSTHYPTWSITTYAKYIGNIQVCGKSSNVDFTVNVESSNDGSLTRYSIVGEIEMLLPGIYCANFQP